MRVGDEVVIRGTVAEIGDVVVTVDVNPGRRIFVGRGDVEVEVKHFKPGELVKVKGYISAMGLMAYPVLAEHDGWVWLGNEDGQSNPWTARSIDCELVDLDDAVVKL
jgi:hypothetical protein